MIKIHKGIFLLATQNTNYAFQVLESGHLEHLHYGECLVGSDLGLVSDASLVRMAQALSLKRAFAPGNTVVYSKAHPSLALERLPQEISSWGKGDVRQPLVEVQFEDGATTCNFVYHSHTIKEGRPSFETNTPHALMPTSYAREGDEGVHTLEIILVDDPDDNLGINEPGESLQLVLQYTVFEKADVITRSTRLINGTGGRLTVDRLMSSQLDLEGSSFEVTSFTGAWAREMQKHTSLHEHGTWSMGSVSGVSSNRANPFFMVSPPQCGEQSGSCYGFNLVYSGNHQALCEVSALGTTRVLWGVHPRGFRQVLEPGSSLQAPEALMSYSKKGTNGLSQNMHYFVRHHIVRGPWQFAERPILLNSWEAHYFNFKDTDILSLAKRARALGVELVVLDDGWFGQRSDDQRGLGDWEPNLKKLPQGLGGLANQIENMGLKFGIWVEPEMVNMDSNLYRSHPTWAIMHPQRAHAQGRNQLLLDLSQPQVQDFVYESVAKILKSGPIHYVKWDMNRIFSDIYSQGGGAGFEGQMALQHRYVLGLYAVLQRLMQDFSHVLFEGCASGGNRFDLGILAYMPQIWASDNTDAISRLAIQNGYSYGYPPSTMGAHVSDCPNHQTLRDTPLATRQVVSSFGLLGYEMNFAELDRQSLVDIRLYIQQYKDWRLVFQFGSFYRIDAQANASLAWGQSTSWTCVSQDGQRAVAAIIQQKTTANAPDLKLVCCGLDPEAQYRVYNVPMKHNVKAFGDLVNAVSPIRIPNRSLRQHLLSKVYPIPGEREEGVVSGALLCGPGLKLKQGFCGMGFNDQVRLFRDYDARMYYIERM